MKSLLARHRMKFGLGFVVCVILLSIVVAYGGPIGHWIARASEWSVELVREAPAPIFFLGMALIPIAGLPIVPFYLAAGAVYGLWGSLLGVGVALLINFSISFWVAKKLRGPVTRLLARAGWTVPELPEGEYVPFTVLVRMTPGAPLMVQNYVLGLAGAPFLAYIGVSWCTEMLIAAGYILTGESLYARNWSFLFAGIAMIVFVVLLTRYLRKWLHKRALPEIQPPA